MSDLPPHPPPGGSRHGEGQPAGGPPSGVPPFGAPPPGGPPPPAGPPPGQGQPRSRTLLVVGLAVVVVAAAGGAYLMSQDGGGEDLPPLPELSAEEQEYADALAGVAREEQGASEDEAACVGAAMVEVIGIDALRDAAAPDNLDAGLTMLRIFGVELSFGSGSGKVFPQRWLNPRAMRRVISTCCTWSCPTGTSCAL